VIATEIAQTMTRCIQPASWWIRKLSGRWFILDREHPGEALRGPMFKRKKDAIEFPQRKAMAVWKRLREGMP